MAKAQYGSDVVVDLMQRFGIEYASLNPGSSFRGLHDSIVNYGQNNPKIITCQHEEIAIQIAHGYARVTGKPMVAIVHDVVGLLHGAMAVYYAHLDHEVPLPDPARSQPPAPLTGDPATLEQIADLLVKAEMPVILTEYTGRAKAGFDALIDLAEWIGAGVIDLHERQNFPTTHPLA